MRGIRLFWQNSQNFLPDFMNLLCLIIFLTPGFTIAEVAFSLAALLATGLLTVARSRIGFRQLSTNNTGTSSCHLLPPFGRGSDGFCLLRRILFLGNKKRIVDGVFLAGRGGVILGGGQSILVASH